VTDRFYRVPGHATGGSGLGLAIVRKIAELHRARLVLEDGPGGKGLRAGVRFPLP
jgi:signal transduction histidine kinase